MSSGLYNTHKTDFDTTLDLTKIKPYGDTMNDGKVQMSFTLPIKDDERGEEAARQLCKKMGLEPYYMYRQKNMAGNFENVGYAKPGCEGLYNILIMEEKQTIMALGAGAITKFVLDPKIERVENVKDITNYLERTDEMIERKRKKMEELGLI